MTIGSQSVEDDSSPLDQERPRFPIRAIALPAVVWLYLVLSLQVSGGMPLVSSLIFTGYLLVMIVIPGTLVWRLLRTWRTPDLARRPLLEDIALGTVLGYACEIPVYLACRAVALPQAIWLWPLAVISLTLLLPAGRRLWGTSLNAPAPPRWFTLGLAALLVVAISYLAVFAWAPWPGNSIPALENPYVDEPFHLALMTEFRHHVPAQIPYVAGTPLFYHWLTYVHLASSSWATGIEPALLLQVVNLPVVILVAVVAMAMVTARVTGTWWTGLLTATGLVTMSAPQLFHAWLTPPGGAPFGTGYSSPTQVFATMLVIPLLLIMVEMLRGELRGRRWWFLFAFMFLVVAGGKSAFPPILMCGLAAAAGLTLLTTRRIPRAAAGLTVVSVAMFLVAQHLFYGTGSRSLVVDPLMAMRWVGGQAKPLQTPDGEVPGAVLAILVVWFVTSSLVSAAGMAGCIRRDGWKDPAAQFLFVTFLTGLVAMLVLGHPSLSQLYFFSAARTPVLLLTAIGLARLNPAGHPGLLRVCLLALGMGGLLGLGLAPLLTLHRPTGGESPEEAALHSLVVPMLIFWVTVSAIAVAVQELMQRGGFALEQRVLAAALLVFGLGMDLPISQTQGLFDDIPISTKGRVQLPQGAVMASRWLRDHSRPDELVATNNHCTSDPRPGCGHRSFWVAAHSERRVLVQGWGYIAPETVGQPSNEITNSDAAPFWDMPRLEANDEAFTHPSTQSLDRLRDEYHVTWLVVDLRYPRVDIVGLEANADLVHRDGEVAILRLR